MTRLKVVCRRLLVAAGLVALAGCHSGSSSTPASNGYTEVRFVHGSPDAGSVDIAIDGTVVLQKVNYGAVSSYLNETALSGGHTIYVYPAGNDATASALTSSSITLSSGTVYSVVLTGEISPASGSKNLGVQIFDDVAYTTATGFAGVNIHHASPAEAAISSSTEFGYAPIASSSSVTSLGSVSYGSATGPQSLAASLKGTPLIFFAVGNLGNIEIEPSQIDGADSTNSLPYGTDQNLTLYFIDGASASKAPSAGASGGTAQFVGAFDPDNL